MPRPLALIWLPDDTPFREALAQTDLERRLEVLSVPAGQTPKPAALARAEILLAWNAPPGMLDRMPGLRWVQSMTAGVEHWLGRPDLRPGIALTCARGTHRIQMPENILGALFHLTKPYAAATLDQRERRWTRRMSTSLAGSTLGILGLGAIGREVARKAAALEMRVIGTRHSGQPVAHCERVWGPDGTDEVLARSDFVLLLLPHTPATADLIDARRLARMKPGAWLLNFARGGLIVDADLVEAVRSGVIAGAVLDVFRTEPLAPEHPFWTTPGILVLPHIGGGHPRREHAVAELFAANARAFLDGRPLSMLVDRARGY